MKLWMKALRASVFVMVAILLAVTIPNTTMADEAGEAIDSTTTVADDATASDDATATDETAVVEEPAPPVGFRSTTWGMSKSEVNALLGSPVLQDMFSKNTWTYAYTNQIDGGSIEKKNLVLEFKKDKLVQIK